MLKTIVAKKGVYFLILRETAFLLGWGVLLLLFLTLLIGFFGGWFLARKIKLYLLKISSRDRVLIFAPHPDDETLAAGGLISYLSSKKIPKKIVFLTVGDGNPYSFLEKRKIKYGPEEYINTGFRRQKEAINALERLGIKQKEIIFLGYPDAFLFKMFKNPNFSVINKGRVNFIPYDFSPDFRKEASGENLLTSLRKIIKDFKPTKIFLPHRSDNHSDHKATFLFVERALESFTPKPEVFQYLVQIYWKFWRVYPRKSNEEKIVYPPKFIIFDKKWYSFWLNREEVERKKKALLEYQSQFKIPTLKPLFKELFGVRNEIFEKL